MPELKPNLRGEELAVAIVTSRFNEPVCAALLQSCREALLGCGVAESATLLVSVPGALEIPLTLQTLAESGRFDALIALGAVIRGETYHFEIVANESARAVMDATAYGCADRQRYLTTENEQQALARVKEKGADAARVVVEMANHLKVIDEYQKRT
jgi:6,7-dimethyl-8-ribityllumazine synthase